MSDYSRLDKELLRGSVGVDTIGRAGMKSPDPRRPFVVECDDAGRTLEHPPTRIQSPRMPGPTEIIIPGVSSSLRLQNSLTDWRLTGTHDQRQQNRKLKRSKLRKRPARPTSEPHTDDTFSYYRAGYRKFRDNTTSSVNTSTFNGEQKTVKLQIASGENHNAGARERRRKESAFRLSK